MTTIDPRMLPIGPELDDAVERLTFQNARRDWTVKDWEGDAPPYSTDPKWTMNLLEYMATGAVVTIRSEYDHASDLAGGTAERWIVLESGPADLEFPEPYECQGVGATLAEAICHCAVHMQEGD